MSKIEKGTGNVFADLGLPDPEDYALKAILVRRVNSILARRHMTQSEAAKVLGISQPKVSNLKKGKLNLFSIEKLLGMLLLLDRNVEIRISDRRTDNPTLKVTTGNKTEVALAA